MTVAVQAARPLRQVRSTSIELREMGDQLDRRIALAVREELHAREKLVIRQAGSDSKDVFVHVPVYHRALHALCEGPGRPQDARRVHFWAPRLSRIGQSRDAGDAFASPLPWVSSETSRDAAVASLRSDEKKSLTAAAAG